MYLRCPVTRNHLPRIPFLLGTHCWWYPSHPLFASLAAQAAWDSAHWVGVRLASLWGRPGLRAYSGGRAYAFWHLP